MCQLNAYAVEEDRQELILEAVSRVEVEGHRVHLSDLFGERKTFAGRISLIDGNDVFLEPAHEHHEHVASDDAQKLAVLLSHWIEHNVSHNQDLERWAQKAAALDKTTVHDEIANAMTKVEEANEHLRRAREGLSAEPM